MKNYWVSFGVNDPRTYTGLSPTFIMYFNQLGVTLAPPGVTEIFAGSGFYRFQASIGWSQSVAFLVDGGASAGTARYVRGTLDSSDSLDLTVGYTASSFGDTAANPGDVMGYLKRNHELLSIKTLTQDTTGVTKT